MSHAKNAYGEKSGHGQAGSQQLKNVAPKSTVQYHHSLTLQLLTRRLTGHGGTYGEEVKGGVAQGSSHELASLCTLLL